MPMNECPIFKLLDAGRRLSMEIDQFWADVQHRLCKADPKIFDQDCFGAWDNDLSGDEDDHYWVKTGATAAVAAKIRVAGALGKPRDCRLSFRLDLWRALPDGYVGWPYAAQALFVIGYCPNSADFWTGDELAITFDGKLKDRHAWEASSSRSISEGKLLEWESLGRGNKDKWSERAWLFAVPLQVLQAPSDVDTHIVEPIIKLLTGGEPNAALERTKAVKWNLEANCPEVQPRTLSVES
jgi:hypothetical protein